VVNGSAAFAPAPEYIEDYVSMVRINGKVPVSPLIEWKE
jgi:hypothetical protein